MNADRMQTLLQGQSSVAQKVFEVVPIQEAWASARIKGELERMTKSNISLHVLRGCLSALRDARLIRETTAGHYQRTAPKATPPADKETPMQKSQIVPTAAAATAPVEQRPATETLGALAGQLRTLGDDARRQLHRIASDIETAALAIEQEREDAAVKMDKLLQLQSLLKSLQG